MICKKCGASAVIGLFESTLRAKFDLPPPTLCPACRHQRRLASVNQMHLFRRNCDATGRALISNYHRNSPFPVYHAEYWNGDQWDAKEFGRDFDFKRPFFEQFAELQRVVPRPALFTDYRSDVNSEYTNYAACNKDCYLIFQSGLNEGCLYGFFFERCRNSLDSYSLYDSELCCESVDSERCYRSAFLRGCENCNESLLLENCIGCKSCIGCINLRHKEFHILNEPVSREEFERVRQSLHSRSELRLFMERFEKLRSAYPQCCIRAKRCEEVSGDHLVECARAHACFDSQGIEDGMYCTQVFTPARDVLDCDGVGQCELLCEAQQSGLGAYDCRFVAHCLRQVSHLTYCDLCVGSSDLFGCVGIQKGKFCILNKQYDEGRYRKQVREIIDHMKKTGEWGNFFPIENSTVPYNLSMAQLRYPLTKEQALEKKYWWLDEDLGEAQQAPSPVPDLLPMEDNSILSEVYACENCNRQFKFVKQELELHRILGFPLSNWCWFCRHNYRLNHRTPQKLWQRECLRCSVPISTSYSPSSPERIMCELCFETNADERV